MGFGAPALVSCIPVGCEIALRAMTAADLAEVVSIERASFLRPWTPDAFRHELGLPFSRALIAHPVEVPTTVAGYVVFWHVADEVHVLDLAVDAAYRRRGIGRLLAQEVVDGARWVRASLITLEVAETNHAARELYAALGFQPTQLRRDYYGDGRHALVMQRRLDDTVR